MNDNDLVLSLNATFYKTFAEGNYSAMQGLWSTQNDVAVIHPGWAVLSGYEPVMQSWERIMNAQGPTDIICIDEKVYLLNSSAYVTCTEVLGDNRLAATNIFVKEDNEWKMVHHQASPIPITNKNPDLVIH